jgi:hypothetical protein
VTNSSAVTAAPPEATDGSPTGAPTEATAPASPAGPALPDAGAPDEPPAGDDVVRVSPTGRWVRTLVTVVGFALLVTGTWLGQDDHFPFGPFRMYAHSAKDDGVVRSARLEGVNATGERFKLTDASTGLRRAEIEGQIPRFRQDGDRLEAVAEAYHARHPDAPELVLVEILQRRYQLRDGEPTGEVTEGQVAVWVAPGYEDLADYDGRVEGSEPRIVAEAQAPVSGPDRLAGTGDARRPQGDDRAAEGDDGSAGGAG